jgi:hypothetical protein
MMKKSGAVAALTAALLAMAVLVTTGCLVPEPEAGGGKVRIIIGDSDARTVIPGAPTFTSYVLTFAGAQVATKTVIPTDTTGATPAPFADIELAAGNYTLTVVGNIAGDLQVAKATTATGGGITTTRDLPTAGTGFTVVSDGFTVITVVLKPSIEETGTFTWTVTADFPATIVVSVGASVAGGGANGTDPDVPSGYYPIKVNVDAGALGDLIFGDYVHIYDNSTSTFTKNFELKHLVPPSPDPNPGEGRGGISYTHPADDPSGANVAIAATAPAGAASQRTLSLTGKTVGGTIYPTAITLSIEGTATGLYYGDTLVTTANVNTSPFNSEGERELTLWYELDGVTYTEPFIITIED